MYFYRSGSPRLNSHVGALTKNSSRSSSSSAGLVHKHSGGTLSSAYDPLEFQLGQQPPIDAITGVVSEKKSLFISLDAVMKFKLLVTFLYLKCFNGIC